MSKSDLVLKCVFRDVSEGEAHLNVRESLIKEPE